MADLQERPDRTAENARLAYVTTNHYDGQAMVVPGHVERDVVDQVAAAEFPGQTVCAEHVCWWLQPRVMWCERHGDPCDLNGEWHGHWHEIRPNLDPRTHFTIIHPHRVIPPASTAAVHACPTEDSGVMPCCGRTPFEVPRPDRMTVTEEVTCRG